MTTGMAAPEKFAVNQRQNQKVDEKANSDDYVQLFAEQRVFVLEVVQIQHLEIVVLFRQSVHYSPVARESVSRRL